MNPLRIFDGRNPGRFGLGVLVLAGAFVLAAQQSPAPAPAQSSPPSDPGTVPQAPSTPQQSDGPQSFKVESERAQDDDPGFVLHRTTRRVVVDVVVTGPDGAPVSGLTQPNFMVLEDRKPQSIHGFEVHTPQDDLNPLPPAPDDLPSHTFVNLERTPASGPAVVLLLDFLNTPIEDQMVAHEQILKFLEHKPASTEVAIFALGDRLSMVRGFTTDTARLLADMRSKTTGPRLTAAADQLQRAQTTLDAFLDIGTFLASVNGRKNLLWFSAAFDMMALPQAQDAQAGVLMVGSGVGNSVPAPAAGTSMTVPAVGIGDGEPASMMHGTINGDESLTVLTERLHRVAAALAVSQTAVYPIDVRGLMVEPGYSAALSDPSSMLSTPSGAQSAPPPPHTVGGNVPGQVPASVQSHVDFTDSLTAIHATMEEIAQATGGHAFVNTNGIAAAASQAVNDGASYYTLVYAPSNLNFDGGLRTIHVTLDKPGCKLAYRSAYYAVDPATVTPAAEQSDSLTTAMVHGAPEAQSLIFKAKIDPNGAPTLAAPDSPLAVTQVKPVSRKMRKDPDFLSGSVQAYDIRLAILAKQLQFTAGADGRHHAALEIAVYAYAADGRKLGGTVQHLRATLPPLAYAHALEEGMFHSMHVELPVEAASLRLAIRDPENHRTGSLEVALPLPPAEQAAVAGSGLENASQAR